MTHLEPFGSTRFWCRSCGMVRDSDVAPWCRHNDGDRTLPARRMVPLPAYHPVGQSENLNILPGGFFARLLEDRRNA